VHVTVLISVYNRERFIGDAIDSVFAQDYSDWDILIIDDGSTDGTVEVVKSRLPNDRIQLIQMKHAGLCATTATGIENARGPIITNLDSDDKLMANSLSAVMPYFEDDPRLGYVWTKFVDSHGKTGGGLYPNGKTFFEALMSAWFDAYHQRFYRKEFYLQTERLDTSIRYSEDLQLALLLGKAGCETLHVPRVTYWRRLHPQQITVEHHFEVVGDAHKVRRKFREGNMALAELYIAGLEKDRDALVRELEDINSSFGYKFMRLYSSMIDQILPDGTKRGKLKRKLVDQIRNS